MHLRSIAESPALRGFVSERWALATTSLYLVLFPSSKIFGETATFSGDHTPARIDHFSLCLCRERRKILSLFSAGHYLPIRLRVERGCTTAFFLTLRTRGQRPFQTALPCQHPPEVNRGHKSPTTARQGVREIGAAGCIILLLQLFAK